MTSQPLVSIVTPSRNMASYVRQTVESVLTQTYPRIEYTLMDGGSTDGTVDIVRDLAPRARIVTAANDGGAAAAINAGFAQSAGEILGWLSADDLYAPRAVELAVAEFEKHPDADVVYGDGLWIDSEGKEIRPYPTRDFDPALFGNDCYLCQPAVFFRRSAFERVGGLNPKLRTAYDYDLWIRLSRGGRFQRVREVFACSRMHAGNKTFGDRETVLREAMELQRSYFHYVPMGWVFSYVVYKSDGLDQFWQPLRPSVRTYFQSLPEGLRWNARRPIRFFGDWLRKAPILIDAVRAPRLGRAES